MKDFALGMILLAIGALLIIGVIAIPFAIWPRYSIWQREQAGRAELAEAEWTKRIKVEEAKADLDSAKLKSDAEVARAQGVAEANKIIGDSLKGNDAYLRYLWINKIEEGQNRQVIYVPTEAGLPILESQRLQQEQK
jgi:hypothetical protein